jgi:flagellar hook-associated protein 3 FlgL
MKEQPMRIATSTAYDNTVSTLQRRQQGLVEAQTQLTSGKRVLRASDDPAAAAQAERALAAMSRSESRLRALNAGRDAMQLTESALGDAVELSQQAREKMVAAGNGSYSDPERKIIADALRDLRTQLLAVANRADGSGRSLFGGQGNTGEPLVDAPGGVIYQGTNGQLSAAAGEPMPMSNDGRAVWLQTDDPVLPGSTISIFDALTQSIDELSTPGRTATQVAQTVSEGIARLDATTVTLSSWRSRAGEALNQADGIGSRLSQAKLDAQTHRSDAEDLDMVAAISDFQAKQTGYDAALKTYSTVQRMTLLDYLR